ncbi:MAG: hypothetical protein VKK80_08435 [Prochlorothrix sp.]|nr:hypothetical protein [Prochlorothrix sp.]
MGIPPRADRFRLAEGTLKDPIRPPIAVGPTAPRLSLELYLEPYLEPYIAFIPPVAIVFSAIVFTQGSRLGNSQAASPDAPLC